ncbi:filamentous hemagglutinin N-terminal domain-containing protein [Arcobacter sp. FWKO B]|uniref:two-partner secretion domain-containing protein n=1 Tax=Arcobacter sp. FWKO B TaxID=2593672 RepID=UPI0018A67E3D|nr:filamentous hemagglutinin N-terminal domain-containing protein [Arcobacter sp. FWKO B]QOG12847.1 filamentous hemagglutinin N-terminal domain-containing protein [Arcobacter sp. FWKO B]
MKLKQSIAIFVSFILVAEQTALYAGGIEVDAQAPNANKATLLNSPNNVPIINIVTPNSSGLSHNKFTNFNVENKGLILNNSKVITDTQLAGYISYNPNLTGNEAKLILNEVTSTNKTLLQGYTEVAGKSADVIIANPNGISVNGGGFINTPNATLTTGTPMLNDGVLQGFDVSKGNIIIDGNGFNGNNIDKVNLYAKALEINAKIYANELNVVTGENNISQDGTVTSKNKSGSGISIDSTLLGGIYANTITLKSTDKGIGVNLPPEVFAQNSLSLNVNGDISFSKTKANTITAKSNEGSININKDVYSKQTTLIAEDNIVINNQGALNSENSIYLKSNKLLNDGIIFSGLNEDKTINDIGIVILDNDITINNAQINASNNVTLSTRELTNNGLLYAGNDLLISSDNLTNNRTIFSANNMYLYTKNTLKNNKASDIFAMNNLLFAADILNNKTDLIENNSANIHAFNGDISFYASNLNNLTVDLVIDEGSISEPYGAFAYSGYFYNETVNQGIAKYCGPASRWCGTHSEDYYKGSFTSKTETASSYTPSNIVSGNDMFFYINDTLNNEYSLIQANNNILISTNVLNNKSRDLKKNITESYFINTNANRKFYSMGWNTLNTTEIIGSVPSTIQSGGSIIGNISRVTNGEINENIVLPVRNESSIPNVTIKIPDNDYGLFIKTKDTKAQYLIETNPKFTLYKNFVGSDYFFEKIGFSLDDNIKRLGDGFYETTLITDSIFKQIGKRFIDKDILDENIQYKVLMDNAIQAQKDLQLAPGITLTKEQINMLKQDIVWMEESIIDGQRVLIPIVYFANLDSLRIVGGQIIANKDIDLEIDVIQNSGILVADNNIRIDASDSIMNYGGVIKANEKLTLEAKNTIRNTSGEIEANEIDLKSGDIINETFSKKITDKTAYYEETKTLFGITSKIEAKKDLNIIAENDFINVGSTLKANNINILANNVDIVSLQDERDFFGGDGFRTGDSSKSYTKEKSIKNLASNLEATNSINIASNNNINIQSSNLNADGDINMVANEINITAVNDLIYQEQQFFSKKPFSKKTQKDMSYKEEVVSSNIIGKNIIMQSGKDINLEAVNIKAQEDKIAYAQGDINIVAKEYKEGELHQTSKSSFGGLIKSEYKYDKDNLKIKSTEITADNMILDAKEINVQASRIKANEVEISTEILNMISSKERLYENEYSNKGGIITATIENKGQIKEIVIPATIEVNDRLIFNKKDITDQLTTDNLIKVLSSQGNLSEEQINLVKQIANDNDWHTKTTTLSATGALIVQAIVTYFTASAGSGLTSSISNVALKAATNAAIQSVISQITVQLATSAITGNSLQLDVNSIAKGAVSAGVMSYASSMIDSSLNLENLKVANMSYPQQLQQGISNTVVKSAIDSAIYGTDFKDSLKLGLVTNASNLGFRAVGDYEVNQLQQGNTSWEDGSINKTITHSLIGGTIAKLQGEDFKTGAVAAGTRELLSPLTVNSSQQTQLLTSQLTGILVGGLSGGDSGASVGYNIATSAEIYNRQLHKDEIQFIRDNAKRYAEKYNLTEREAIKELYNTAMYINDKESQRNISIMTEEQKVLGLIAVNGMDEINFIRAVEFLFSESAGKMIVDTYKEQMSPQPMFTSTLSQFINNGYTMDSTIGLVDSSATFVPTVKVGQTFYNTGKVVTPYVVRQTGQVYDDVTLGIISQGNKVAPNLTNKYILDPYNSLKIIGGIEVINDIFNESNPIPSTVKGAIGSLIKNIDDKIKEVNNAE